MVLMKVYYLNSPVCWVVILLLLELANFARRKVAFTFGKGRQYMIYMSPSFHGKKLLCSTVFWVFPLVVTDQMILK